MPSEEVNGNGHDVFEPLTLVICSNRHANLRKHWRSNFESLQEQDAFIVVWDAGLTPQIELQLRELELSGVTTIVNNENRGLAYSRNLAIACCRTNYLLFIDDDVTIKRETVNQIRRHLSAGYQIVGVRICGPAEHLELPWYISPGQLHYLAIHDRDMRTSGTWGACMAISMPFVRAGSFKFRQELGRKGRGLQSGDDTTFLRELRHHGANEVFLRNVSVNHNIDRRRLSVFYMLRRAYWQGRSEQRRNEALKGLKKEWTRFIDADAPACRRILLSVMYIVPVILGISVEKIARLVRRGA